MQPAIFKFKKSTSNLRKTVLINSKVIKAFQNSILLNQQIAALLYNIFFQVLSEIAVQLCVKQVSILTRHGDFTR